ncbi:hypothetical protein M3Y97_00862200 [Aphelenchoides bicaudatus]|nr:hypothetical protein M3Y97_00862200 [Aphelenchoides bicaudatus]
MDSMESTRKVPILLALWEEDLEDTYGPILNDIFLGLNSALPTPLQETCVAFVVDQEQDINSSGFYGKFNNAHQQNTHYNSTSTLLNNDQHPNHENKWFDDYVSLNEDTFGSSSRSLPINTGTHFPTQSLSYDTHFYSNSFAGFQHPQQSADHQMQDLSGPSTSSGSRTTTQFSQLNLRETSSSQIEPLLRVAESEYSASFSPPGSAYSSDWSSGSNHSAQSQDEILEEIRLEAAEIERKSVSPPLRQKNLVKRRSGTVVKHSSEHLASNSSTNSLSGLGNSDRKKELNRIAATKYREKKRRERDLLGSEHKHLETRNHQLRSTVKELKTEVSYLRKLMKDMEVRAKQV